MNPKEFVAITKYAMDEFEKWYELDGKNKEGSKEALKLAYLAASSSMLSKISIWVQDRLYSSDSEKDEIEENQAFETYIERAIYRLASNLADDMVNAPLRESLQDYKDLVMKQIFVILESYSGKKLSGYDDDDGIEGEEAEARHLAMDGTISAISSVKKGVLNKDGVVRTFRALADFYEKEI